MLNALNAQQELNLHTNALQAELKTLVSKIDALLAKEPDEDGARRMPWTTPSLPTQVFTAMLEAYRDRGLDYKIVDGGRSMDLVLRSNREAVPTPITSW